MGLLKFWSGLNAGVKKIEIFPITLKVNLILLKAKYAYHT